MLGSNAGMVRGRSRYGERQEGRHHGYDWHLDAQPVRIPAGFYYGKVVPNTGIPGILPQSEGGAVM